MGKYRFAFDIGTTSIGWAVFDLDARTGNPIGLARTNHQGTRLKINPLGVRIFDDGRNAQSQESKAAVRRKPRSMRRMQDRRLARRNQLELELQKANMLPTNVDERKKLFELNPYELRASAAKRRVTLHELGRALWHMSKHRGFKSNRKVNKPEEDSGLIKSASDALHKKLKKAGNLTYGDYLWMRLQANEGARVRAQGENASKHFEFYPTRDLLESEFDIIWDEQCKHHNLGEDLRIQLRDRTIFYQRDLRPVLPGRCTFLSEEDRIPRWHPAAQAFLILQDLANLRITRGVREEQLDQEKRDILFKILDQGQKLTWNAVRKLLSLNSSAKLNLEDGGLKHLHFNQVSAALVGTQRKPGPLADRWLKFDAMQREDMVEKLAISEEPQELLDWLKNSFGLKRTIAKAVEEIYLPDGYLRFCRGVTIGLVNEMRKDAIDYSEAVKRAPILSNADFSHSGLRSEKGLNFLPRYNELEHLRRMLGNGTNDPDDPYDKRLGKIANPTVHIALGQFRRVMNNLIHVYGKPAEVVLESARDLKKSLKEKEKIKNLIASNTNRNNRYRKELEEEGRLAPGQRVGDRFLLLRLWEELGANIADRCSPFSGKPICKADLFSENIEIEHILPFERTFDDSPANKTLAFRGENQRKGDLSPGEAAAIGVFDQETMLAKASFLPRNKAWRFAADAMEIFEQQKSFYNRQLNDTSYLARISRAYVEVLFDKKDSDGKERNHVWVLTGRMTAMLRHRWGLNLGDHNRKNRNDHRHHAIDAAVIGVIDRAMIKRLQVAAKALGSKKLSRVLPSPPEPYPDYRKDILQAVELVNISYRAQHGNSDPGDPSSTSGRLHEDTAYGLIRDIPETQAERTIGNVVVRKLTTALTEKEINQIRDVKLRHSALSATKGSRVAGLSKKEAEKLRAQLLSEWVKNTGHRNLRIIKSEAVVKPVYDKKGRAHKFFAPGEIHYIDLIEIDGKWVGHAQSVWEANSEKKTGWHEFWPTGRFIMRIHKGDTIQLFDWDEEEKAIVSGRNAIKKVVRLNPSQKRVFLSGQFDAGSLQKRKEDDEDPFDWDIPNFEKLRLRRARRVRIDELGRVHTIPQGKT